MSDEHAEAWEPEVPDADELERAVLADTPEGRRIASRFVEVFGAFVSDDVRPLLRDVAAAGEEPQLLLNGLASLLREVADSIEMAPGASRDGDEDRRAEGP